MITVEQAAGRWERIRALRQRAERAVAENVQTPCVYDAHLLLSCAVACAELGLDAEARTLEDDARALGFEGYGVWLDPLHARLALLRGDLDQVNALLEESDKWLWSTYNHLYGVTTRLDALVGVGRRDEAEAQAIRVLQPGTYLEPFALRTLGLVRGDGELLAQAIERFQALGSTGTPPRVTLPICPPSRCRGQCGREKSGNARTRAMAAATVTNQSTIARQGCGIRL